MSEQKDAQGSKQGGGAGNKDFTSGSADKGATPPENKASNAGAGKPVAEGMGSEKPSDNKGSQKPQD
ncbi:MAG: hypothetical protein MSG64_03070 [Pyrinomonadaceae bacterium MAG19_C2-C3]|nr:hypothetical protein [Pyrinomonadaceae bacterium MAG19_C2-C3]